MNSAVGAGKTLEAAVEDALLRLGARPDQVTLKKLEEGGPAGLMGNVERLYRVRATWRPEFAPPPPPEPALHHVAPETFREPRDVNSGRRERGERPGRGHEERGHEGRGERGPRGARGERGGERGERGERGGRGGRRERSERPERPRRPSAPYEAGEPFDVTPEFLEQVRREAEWLLGGMGLEAEIVVTYDGEEVLVSLTGEEDESLLTGRRGETRISIQQVLSRLVNPRRGPGAHLVVDVNGYLASRRTELLARARELAQEALATGEEQLTEPLSSDERRAVHRALTKDGGVVTESYGDGALKRVAIRPAPVS